MTLNEALKAAIDGKLVRHENESLTFRWSKSRSFHLTLAFGSITTFNDWPEDGYVVVEE